MSGSGPGERWTSRLYHWFCYIFTCLHVSLVYCVLCLVSRVSCLCRVSLPPPHVFIRSLCAGGRDARWGWEPSVLCALCSVLCDLCSVLCDLWCVICALCSVIWSCICEISFDISRGRSIRLVVRYLLPFLEW